MFRPSRRPPAPAVLGQPRVEPAAVAAPSAPERPQLTLVGAVVGETEGIAIFLDSNNEVIRLRTGQDYSGWVLNGVRGREATLQRDSETAVFALPAPTAYPRRLGRRRPTTRPQRVLCLVCPVSLRRTFRASTPQDGSHDGL